MQETENQKEQKTVKYCSVLIKDVRKHPWWGPKVRQLSGPAGTGVKGGSTAAPLDSGINRSRPCSSEKPSTSSKVRKVWQIDIVGVKVYDFCSGNKYFQASFLLALSLKLLNNLAGHIIFEVEMIVGKVWYSHEKGTQDL